MTKNSIRGKHHFRIIKSLTLIISLLNSKISTAILLFQLLKIQYMAFSITFFSIYNFSQFFPFSIQLSNSFPFNKWQQFTKMVFHSSVSISGFSHSYSLNKWFLHSNHFFYHSLPILNMYLFIYFHHWLFCPFHHHTLLCLQPTPYFLFITITYFSYLSHLEQCLSNFISAHRPIWLLHWSVHFCIWYCPGFSLVPVWTDIQASIKSICTHFIITPCLKTDGNITHVEKCHQDLAPVYCSLNIILNEVSVQHNVPESRVPDLRLFINCCHNQQRKHGAVSLEV